MQQTGSRDHGGTSMPRASSDLAYAGYLWRASLPQQS